LVRPAGGIGWGSAWAVRGQVVEVWWSLDDVSFKAVVSEEFICGVEDNDHEQLFDTFHVSLYKKRDLKV
jgi:hypothetical protein